MNNKVIVIAVAVALIMGGAGFYGGTVYGKKSLVSNKQGGIGMMAGNFSGRSVGADGQGQARSGGIGMKNGNGGGFLTGQIIAKDDKSITVKDRNGSSKIILYSSSSTVGKTVDGSTADLATGQDVMVTGTTNSDGSLTAQNIQIRPAASSQDAGGGASAGSATN
ncbi:MAG: DUF5666 domain-containing protein [Parcubacteria group bacterium]